MPSEPVLPAVYGSDPFHVKSGHTRMSRASHGMYLHISRYSHHAWYLLHPVPRHPVSGHDNSFHSDGKPKKAHLRPCRSRPVYSLYSVCPRFPTRGSDPYTPWDPSFHLPRSCEDPPKDPVHRAYIPSDREHNRKHDSGHFPSLSLRLTALLPSVPPDGVSHSLLPAVSVSPAAPAVLPHAVFPAPFASRVPQPSSAPPASPDPASPEWILLSVSASPHNTGLLLISTIHPVPGYEVRPLFSDRADSVFWADIPYPYGTARLR